MSSQPLTPDSRLSTLDWEGGEARLVLLGASNLTMALSTVVGTARRILAEERLREVLVAAGHGRSYASWSTVLLRSLPGIVECGLWRRLEEGSGPIYGLITDVGNDLMYGARPEHICGWVETCVKRLRRHPATITLTLLPGSKIENLHPLQFQIFRRLLFPGRSGSLARIQGQVGELNGLLLDLGQRHRLRLVEPRATWYGIDAVHLRRRLWRQAWAEILGAWSPGRQLEIASPSLLRWLRLRAGLPQRGRFLGRAWQRRQPAASLADGTPVFVY